MINSKLKGRRYQQGQVVIVLLLTIVVALAIGLSVSTISISEVANSAKIEQSSRSYSAAQAGIEKALLDAGNNISGTSQIALGNQSVANVSTSTLLPVDSSQSIEFGLSGIGKDDVAQVWLSDPNTLAGVYLQPTFSVYFGNPSQAISNDNPAIEVHVIVSNAGVYQDYRYYFDSYKSTVDARGNNGFDKTCTFVSNSTINTTVSAQSSFYCQALVSGYKSTSSTVPIMARIRMLYSSGKQKLAVAPRSTDATISSSQSTLPPQVRVITSTGVAGSTQRTLQIFTQSKILPSFLDYALFSPGDITHN